jgi:hypothetical protein
VLDYEPVPAPVDPAASLPGAPPTAAPVAGMRGAGGRSLLARVSSPGTPGRFEFDYSFPDRARWFLEDEGAPRTRVASYRYGENVWSLEAGATTSAALEGAERARLAVSMELRRALLLWPHGFAWSDGGTVRRATPRLPGSEDASLEVRLDDDGVPVRFTARDAVGEELEALAIVERAPDTGDPARLELHVGGELVWREELESVRRSVVALDRLFVPTDRLPPPPDAGPTEVLAIELPARCVRAYPIPAGTTPPELEEQLRSSTNGSLADESLLQLDRDGTPEALVMRLAGLPDPPPEGWRTDPGGPAVTAFVANRSAVGAALIERMRAALAPSTSGPVRIWTRDLAGAPAGRGTQVIAAPAR